MSIINILAKLPNEVKERIENPSALRINNDSPGLYIPKEQTPELKNLLSELRVELDKKKNKTTKVEQQIKLIDDMTHIIDHKINVIF